jgi:2-amino-4-hydroxy-6-hydroxymethyldihydropteridine diphosphokinase
VSLYIALGSNLGSPIENLNNATIELKKHFEFIEKSRIYQSEAVDYINQPNFFNQVLEFKTPSISPADTMTILLKIESELGRKRDIDKGPRIIDIDILFFDNLDSSDPHIVLPHPRLFERSFVVLPLMELKSFKSLKKSYSFSTNFDNEAFPIS